MKNVLIFCTVIFLYFKTSYMDDNLDNEHNLTVHLQAIYQLDDQQCIPRLLCELASTRNKNLLSPQEKSVLKLFSGSGLNITEESLQVKYKSAIRIGVKNGNSYVCAVKYASCPLNRRELMMIFNIISTPSGELN